MGIKVSARPPMPDNIFIYEGHFFELNRTIKGRVKPLTKAELTRVQKHLGAIFDHVISEGAKVEDIQAFDLTTGGKPTFYSYNDADSLYIHGHLADKTYSIEQSLINNLLGIKVETSSNDKDTSSSPQPDSSSSAVNPSLYDSENFEAKRSEIAESFDSSARIDIQSLAAYNLFLENSYSEPSNRLMILDPAIIQDTSKINEHPKINQAINLFNSDIGLNTIYLPIHVGSRQGYHDGHWILAALTRAHGNANTVIVYNPTGTVDRDQVILDHLSQNVTDDGIVDDKGNGIINISSNTVQHQTDSTNCGVHILHFIETMESKGFNNALTQYMHSNDLTENISELRKRFADNIRRAPQEKFQINKADDALKRLKIHHLDKKSENKFVGLEELKKIHRAQLDFFREYESNPDAIIDSNFEWWTFPVNTPSYVYNNLYALDADSLKKLQADQEFLNMYFESMQRVLSAYGWHLKHSDKGYDIQAIGKTVTPLERTRFQKMTESSALLIPSLTPTLMRLAKKSYIEDN